MAIVFVDSTATSDAAAQAITGSIPTGTTTDDFMVSMPARADNIAESTWDDDGGGGNGWTKLIQNYTSGGKDIESALFYKKATSGSETNPTFTLGGSDGHISCPIVTYRGVDTSTPFDVTYNNGNHHVSGENDAMPPNASITTATDNAMVIIWHRATHSNINVGGAPTNYTLRETSLESNSNGALQVFSAERLITSAGAEAPGDWTHTGGNMGIDEYHCYTLALKEAAAVSGIASLRQVIGVGQGTR